MGLFPLKHRAMSLFSWFKKRRDKEIPQDLCLNCWGKQEYDGEVRDLVKDHQKALETGEVQDSFVRRIMVRYVDGIHEQNRGAADNFYCAKCNKAVELRVA